ncbi:MAG: amidohydrolase family protein [Dokdonella sp.]
MTGTAAQAASDLIFIDGFEPPCPGAPPGVTAGSSSGLLLRGTVVTPTVAFFGEVLVIGDTITCAAVSCAGQTGANTATIVETHGLIFPGLIDTHNYALFDVFDENDWSPTQVYTNHNQWPNDPRYGALVDAKQYLNGEYGSPDDDGCELDKYGELKGLLSGVTSLVTHANPSNKICYGSLARTVDQSPNDLGADYIQTATLFPTTLSADGVCANFSSGTTHAYLVNIAEGVDQTALNEFAKLGTITTTDGCLYAPQTAIVHGSALGDPEFSLMSQHNMSLVWLPHSEVSLYGATANVPLAVSKGINVALGADWSITGSHNLLEELRFARAYDDAHWGSVLSDFDLVQMVTTSAAHAIALDATLGSIAVGKKADLNVISANTCGAPWSALVRARARDVRLVMVGGVPLYGDTSMQAAAPSVPGCEALDVCGVSKFVCVAESGGTVANKLGQTLADITGVLTQALTDYDALNLTQWKFSPITPLVDCP